MRAQSPPQASSDPVSQVKKLKLLEGCDMPKVTKAEMVALVLARLTLASGDSISALERRAANGCGPAQP